MDSLEILSGYFPKFIEAFWKRYGDKFKVGNPKEFFNEGGSMKGRLSMESYPISIDKMEVGGLKLIYSVDGETVISLSASAFSETLLEVFPGFKSNSKGFVILGAYIRNCRIEGGVYRKDKHKEISFP